MIAMDMPVSGIYDDYLMHHGIKGMKWGVRRYQNEDGTLTDAGKKRYGTVENFNASMEKKRNTRKKVARGVATAAAASGAAMASAYAVGKAHHEAKEKGSENGLFEQNIKSGKDKPNQSPAEKITKDASKIVSSVSNAVDAAGRLRKNSQPPDNSVKKLSDEELRKRINRLNMERQYADLSRTDTYDGFQKAKDVLAVAVPVAEILAAGAGIAATVYKLKHEETEDDVLMHHGVKGMKWGVRRYEKFADKYEKKYHGGTFTKAGIKRFSSKEQDYQKVLQKKKDAKAAYERGEITKQKYKYAKGDVKRAKNALKLSYKQLKKDKMADQGKRMYKEGKRIRDNSHIHRAVRKTSALLFGASWWTYQFHQQGIIKTNAHVVNGLAATAAGLEAANAIARVKTRYENKRISEFYAH